MNRLQEKYQQTIVPGMQKEFGLLNRMAVPKIIKIVINMGIGDAAHDKGKIEKAVATMIQISGQKPEKKAAKKAIAEFRVRKGNIVGLKTTLRRGRMYDFLDKLITIVLPRIRDFQGIKLNAFDNQGNYSLGLTEQIVFPEVDYDTIDRVRGIEVTLVTNSHDKQRTRRLLEMMGMPFEKIKN